MQTMQRQTTLQSASILRGQLVWVKDQDPLEKKSNLIYQVGVCTIGPIKKKISRKQEKPKKIFHSS